MSYLRLELRELNQTQKQNIISYFYNLCKNCQNYMIIRENSIHSMYNELVSSFNLKEHSNKVIKAVIKQHIKLNELTPYELPNKSVHPFKCRKSLKRNYKEDSELCDDVENFCYSWSTRNEDDINTIRAAFSGKKNIFYKIIAYTFFIEPEIVKSKFIIPDDKFFNSIKKRNQIDSSSVDFLAADFELSEIETNILNLAYLSSCTYLFGLILEQSIKECHMDKLIFYAKCTGYSYREVEEVFRRNNKLFSFGLFDNDLNITDEAINSICDGNTDSLFSDVLKVDSKMHYDINTYNIKEDEVNLASRLLQGNNSVNILLYGAPGAGKTEFARSLIHSLNLKPLIFKNENEVKDEKAEAKVLCKINSLLSIHKKDSVIIVDEAEGVLKTQGSFFGMQYSLPQKGIVNKMLEESHNKVIWILNYTHELDESTRRRFTYAIKFNEMTPTMLKSIADSKLNSIKMSTNLHSELVDLCGKYRVTGASVDNIVKTVSNMNLSDTNEEQVLNDVKKVLESNSTLIFGKKKMRDFVRPDYDLSVLNTSTSAVEILEMVKNAQKFAEENGKLGNGIRMLFYGLSGTGKTELARYLAVQLNKKIILKRPSDILGKYVGDNENNIRQAFEQAESTGDILLFDEADTFFADRSNANTSWERSTVNEFLTQMEEFSGILICTTNLRQIMDPAMQRRFHILTEFKALKPEGIETLLNRYFVSYDFDSVSIQTLSRFKTVTPGDFGTLAGKIKFMQRSSITSEYIITELCKIQEEKESNYHSIGFAL